MMVAMGGCLILGLTFTWFKEAYPNSHWVEPFRVTEELFLVRYMPLFSMGILLNELRCGRGNKWALWGGIAVSAVVFHAVDLREHNPAATVLMFGLLTASAFRKVPLLRWKPLVYISFISYALYLVHNNLGSAAIRQLEIWGCTPIVTLLLVTAMVIGLAHIMTFWLEQPATRYLRGQYQSVKQQLLDSDSVATPMPVWLRLFRRLPRPNQDP